MVILFFHRTLEGRKTDMNDLGIAAYKSGEGRDYDQG